MSDLHHPQAKGEKPRLGEMSSLPTLRGPKGSDSWMPGPGHPLCSQTLLPRADPCAPVLFHLLPALDHEFIERRDRSFLLSPAGTDVAPATGYVQGDHGYACLCFRTQSAALSAPWKLGVPMRLALAPEMEAEVAGVPECGDTCL